MKRIISALLFSLVVISSAAGLISCGGKSEDISVLYYTYSDTYVSSVRSSMDKAFGELKLGHHNYDAAGNQTTQTEQVDTAITKGARLLMVNVVDTGSEDAAKTIIGKAKAADIPLIFFNRSVDEKVIESYDKCVYVGTDYEEAGIIQGQMIGNYLVENYGKLDINGDGRISYVMFKGQQGNLEAESRTKLSVEVANKVLGDAGKPALSFYDKNNRDGYLVDQNGTWSNAAANDHMKTVLSAYSEQNKNMVELVIANNDEMALGALAALEEAGYNKTDKRYIPVFGVDATEGALAKIESGAMTGTVKQDSELMAKTLSKVSENMLLGRDVFMGIDEKMVAGKARINIPYSAYNKAGEEK